MKTSALVVFLVLGSLGTLAGCLVQADDSTSGDDRENIGLAASELEPGVVIVDSVSAAQEAPGGEASGPEPDPWHSRAIGPTSGPEPDPWQRLNVAPKRDKK